MALDDDTRISHEPAKSQHDPFSSSRRPLTFHVDLVNVLYISVFIWTTRAAEGVATISPTSPPGEASRCTDRVVDLTPPLPRPKVYRIIDISRVCEFYIIRIECAFVARLDGVGGWGDRGRGRGLSLRDGIERL